MVCADTMFRGEIFTEMYYFTEYTPPHKPVYIYI